jgi:hypothetical protein
MTNAKLSITIIGFMFICLALGIGRRFDRLEKKINNLNSELASIKYDTSDNYYKLHDANNVTLIKITEFDRQNLEQWRNNYKLAMKRRK